ncbi:MAG: adenosylmethionine decarboxylase [Candidatus Thermoplasmatota archaeon]|jgi:S-adenosylmethionine decarboxylase|nr:adenosylmethionine decarboxylase [Candidatus Thermoplasmatota archaeon]MDA8143248.1 adenosylmethionine decarboxylase [Thermoplasmatales archaeon]
MAVAVGFQILADLYGVDADIISKADSVYPIIEEAVRVGNLTKISSDYYQFQPMGASGVVLLAESHLSFHTWPEHGLVTLDIYTCGDPKAAEMAFDYIVDQLRPDTMDCKRLRRGTSVTEEVKVERPEHILIP